MSKTRLLTSVATLAVGAALALGPAAAAAQEIVGLITKTNTNPFFVKMKEGAEAKAEELGMELRSYAGKYDGDNQGQVEAVESLIAAGAKGILITPSDSAAIVPTLQQARDAGILVIALDTPLEPADAADATFATDNFEAGRLIGQWAAAKLGEERIRCQDRAARPQRDRGLGRRRARSGLPHRLRRQRQQPEGHRRRGRPADRRPRHHAGRRGGRPHGDGEPAPARPGHQRRLHHQRAGGGRRLRGAERVRLRRAGD